MPTEISTSTSVTIDATAARVWEALTTPELIKEWFFGVDTETDWAEGSPIVHRGEFEGTAYEDEGLRLRPSRFIDRDDDFAAARTNRPSGAPLTPTPSIHAEAIDPSVASPLCAAKAAKTSSFSRAGTPK